MLKRCCSRCGAFLEGYTFNNVTGEYGYRGGDGGWYKDEEEYKATLKPKYIRFGGIPEGEKSFAWNIEGEVIREEPGVSVYHAVRIDGQWHIVFPMPITTMSLNTILAFLQYKKCRVFLVTGDEVGKGSDNEPCIRNVKIVEELTDKFKIEERNE